MVWFGSAARCLLILASLPLLACGTSSTYVETGRRPVPQPDRQYNEVQVFTVTRPTRPFREAGLIESRQASGWSTDGADDVVRELRREAAARGCDGVILTGSADEVVGGTAVGAGGALTQTVTTLKGYRAICIVYTQSRELDPQKRAMADAGISRLWSAKGHWELSMTVPGSDLKLGVDAAVIDPEHVRVSLQIRLPRSSSTSRAGPAHETCELELLAGDASSVATDREFSTTIVHESVAGTLDTAALEQAAETPSAMFKLCATEIALAETTRKRLATFAAALRAEGSAEPAATKQRLEL